MEDLVWLQRASMPRRVQPEQRTASAWMPAALVSRPEKAILRQETHKNKGGSPRLGPRWPRASPGPRSLGGNSSSSGCGGVAATTGWVYVPAAAGEREGGESACVCVCEWGGVCRCVLLPLLLPLSCRHAKRSRSAEALCRLCPCRQGQGPPPAHHSRLPPAACPATRWQRVWDSALELDHGRPLAVTRGPGSAER
jgi:hypothetical protein